MTDFDQALRHFHDHYERAFQYKLRVKAAETRVRELHPSSFPFCGLRTVYERQTMLLEHGDLIEEASLFSHYFTRIGTQVHTILQDWLTFGGLPNQIKAFPTALRGELVGDWYCPSCRVVTARRVARIPCPKCGSQMDWHEMGVTFGEFITGHIDGLFILDGVGYLIDFKTSSMKDIDQYRQYQTKLPYASNVRQIQSYAYLVENNYGIPIRGYMLVYLARDNPNYQVMIGNEITQLDQQKQRGKLRKYDAHFKHVLTIFDTKKPAIRQQSIQLLVDEKPCKSCKWYHKHMHDSHRGSACPLSKELCWKPNIANHLVNMFK